MRILALVIDFGSSETSLEQARELTLQVARSKGDFKILTVHVDNGNSAVRKLTAAQIEAGVRLLRLPRNFGYGAGIEGALQKLEAEGEQWDAAWLLNSDLTVEPNCLARLSSVLSRESRVGAVGPTVFLGAGRERIWGARGVISPGWGITRMTSWHGGKLPRWSYIPGSSILVRATAYREAGRIPLRYRMYFEETHLCVAMQKKGWDLWVEASAVAHHEVQSRQGKIPAKHFAFYFARNGLYFWKTCFGIPPLLQLPRTMFVIGKELLLPLRRAPNWRALRENLGWTLAGLWDGFFFLKSEITPWERRLFPEMVGP